MSPPPIKLYWWRHSKILNLGDELSGKIVEFVSGRAVERAESVDADMLAIGSILTFVNKDVHARKSPYLIWGTGSLTATERSRVETFLFSAVRGPLTYSLLGNQKPIQFGDPGLLTSQMWPHYSKSYRWGLIPHFRHVDKPWVKKIVEQTPNCVLIDVRDPDIEASCRLIASCDFIASGSLHGLVIADSYGIPNLWLTDGGVIGSFKYWDYFAGIGRPVIDPVPMELPTDLRVYEERMTKNRYLSALPKQMKQIAAAFPL